MPQGVGFHLYADDTNFMFTCQTRMPSQHWTRSISVSRMSETECRLKLNLDKINGIYCVFGFIFWRDKLSKFFPALIWEIHLYRLSLSRIWVCGSILISKRVHSTCRNCFVQLREFRRVRCYCMTYVSPLMANALISSYLDYCNSLFRSLSKINLCKLQCITKCSLHCYKHL